MDEGFIDSIVHRRAPLLARLRGQSGHVVLGRRLRPFSFWHQQLLETADSPFLRVWETLPATIQIFEQLFIATEICRIKPCGLPARPDSFLARLRRRLSLLRFYIRFEHKQPGRRMTVLLVEAAKFRAYVRDYSTCPIPFPTKKSRSVQTPSSLYQVELYKRFHPDVKRLDIWKLSPGEVTWANTASHEAHGAEIELYTEARRKADQAARCPRKPSVVSNDNGARKKKTRH